MATLNIRVDDDVKREAEAVLDELGISLSAATNIFYRQVIRTGGIPFSLRISRVAPEAEKAPISYHSLDGHTYQREAREERKERNDLLERYFGH